LRAEAGVPQLAVIGRDIVLAAGASAQALTVSAGERR
jgi:hypothetical protein